MDILTHGISGLAIGSTLAAFSTSRTLQKVKIVAIGGFGAILPDLDAISLWSKFDITIGKAFDLVHTGKEIYFSKFWYSHHGFMHSVTAPLIFLSFIFTISVILNTQNSTLKEAFTKTLQLNKILYLSFFLGFCIHLVEDMPTPTCVWGGVNLFWPNKTYFGGSGHIWWWNNYDIFLLAFSVFGINCGLQFIPKTNLKRVLASLTFVIGLNLCIKQIFSRPIDFNYVGHTIHYAKLEKQSQEVQKEILGQKLYLIMKRVDEKIPLNF